MKRPYISISGTLDELILMEAILAYYYDVPDEEWNNECINFTHCPANHLVCNEDGDGKINYLNHPGLRKPNTIFKASQIQEILKHIEEYERRNS